MKAITHRRYGSPDVLALEDLPAPVAGEGEILVRVRAASLNAFDWHILRAHPHLVRTSAGWRRPKRAIAGVDLAGTVEAVGRNVTEFQPGDDVFGERGGALAEFVVGRVDGFVHKPANVSFEAAAATPMAGFTALQALRDKGNVQPGQRVLVTGASGGVGTFAVQLAAAAGASVTAVSRDADPELLRSLGADDVIDDRREDFTRSSQRWDLILDIAANHPLVACRRVLTENGTLVVVGAPRGNWFAPIRRPLVGVLLSRLGRRRLLPFLADRRKADLEILRDHLAAGTLTPIIDRAYPLAEAAAAFRRLEGGGVRGKVVITI